MGQYDRLRLLHPAKAPDADAEWPSSGPREGQRTGRDAAVRDVSSVPEGPLDPHVGVSSLLPDRVRRMQQPWTAEPGARGRASESFPPDLGAPPGEELCAPGHSLGVPLAVFGFDVPLWSQ